MTLLSLPLTNFEEYMLADDFPGHPLTIAARLRFRGQVSEAAATQALLRVKERHPLLHCTVQSRGRRKMWRSSSDPIQPPRFLAQHNHKFFFTRNMLLTYPTDVVGLPLKCLTRTINHLLD